MTEAPEFTIRQSEFAEKHGLFPGEMKDLRNKWLKEDHDFKAIGRPIFLTKNAVTVLEAALATHETDETQTAPEASLPDSFPHPDFPSGNVSVVYGNPVSIFQPTGADPAAEVSAALIHARQKHSTHLTTAAEQSEPLPEPEDEKDLPPVETPENFSAFVLKPCRNARFVYASYNGEQIAVSVHPRHQKKIIRKGIRVRAEKEGETTRYFHVP
jgi:hypothetical protein